MLWVSAERGLLKKDVRDALQRFSVQERNVAAWPYRTLHGHLELLAQRFPVAPDQDVGAGGDRARPFGVLHAA